MSSVDEPTPGPDDAYAAALAGLPGMGPTSLARLLRDQAPHLVWAEVRRGRIVPGGPGRPAARRRPGAVTVAGSSDPRPPEPAGEVGSRADGGAKALFPGGRAGRGPDPGLWATVARRIDPEPWWAGAAARGVRVAWPGQPDYPAAFDADPQPPGVVFWRGSLQWLRRPCVAVIGTRRATPEGQALAFELGRDLAAAGICVVSGLALGIDGAAHTGALQAAEDPGFTGPVGLAASGVDVPYPRRHRELWAGVATHGAVLSETLPGRPAEAWRFPLRNRLIAALARLVVVVESDRAGGSLHTVEAALARGVDVRAVPGPVRSRASAGTNQLLYDGAGVVRDAQDVLDTLGLVRPGPIRAGPGASGRERPDPRGRIGPGADREGSAAGRLPVGLAGTVLEAVGWTPTALEQVVERSRSGVAAARGALASLAAAGLVHLEGGWWVRTGREGGGRSSAERR